ncbi:Remodeling and spacing factor 1 [Brachionus plicatilis]|uniref:Remodeling and spacing factor 1 n=1 Tax=Brachionus plicatilis TaxID=10195 RepID=A0A3M7PG87_BRAPC|nr:Remodeling and spacing factor 1 [Brachionus plicatilis]
MEVANETNQFEIDSLLNDINYGIILSFIDKFGNFLALKEFKFDNFESSLVNQSQTTQYLKDFLWCLIRNTSFGKNLKKDKMEFGLKKFIQKIYGDGFLFEEFCFLDLQTKLKFLQNLIESQFDENPKFKQVINENVDDGSGLRFMSLGKDFNGSDHWFFVDSLFNIRLFTQYSIDVQGYSWKLIARNIQQIKDLIENLLKEPDLEKLNDSERYQKNLKSKSKTKKSGKKQKLISESDDIESNNLETDSETDISKEAEEESRCTKCSEIKDNYLLIICDSCDFRFHVDCLKPQIEKIPDGDWYCPICEHSFLIRNLQKKLNQIELDKKVHEEKEIIKNKKIKENQLKKQEIERELLEQKLENTLSSLDTSVNQKRSRRVKSKINYKFEEFDRQIKEATGINKDESDQEDTESVESFKIDDSESQVSQNDKEYSEFSSYEIDIKTSYLSYDESDDEPIKNSNKRKRNFKIKKKIRHDPFSPEETDMEQNFNLENRMRKFKFFRKRFKRVIENSDDDNEYTAYNEDDYFEQNLDQKNF